MGESMVESLFNNLEDEEKIVIYSLGALDNTPLRSKIKIQKLLFLVANVFHKYKDLLEFESGLFGPYSETLDYITQDLHKLGLIEIERSRYKLTEKGFEIYHKLKPEKELMTVIEDFKDFLNDLPDEEILTFVYVSYPDYISESAKWDELKPERAKVAASLLRKEKVSIGKAVEISGLSYLQFGYYLRYEEMLKKKGIKHGGIN